MYRFTSCEQPSPAANEHPGEETVLLGDLAVGACSSGDTILNFSELGMVSPELRVIKATITIYYFMRNK